MTRKPIEPGNAGDVADQRWPCTGQTVLPPLQLLHKGQHQQMGQRQPDPAQLNQSGVTRVQNAARDAEVGDRVSVQQQVAARKRKKQSDKREKHSGQRDGKRLFAGRRPHLV